MDKESGKRAKRAAFSRLFQAGAPGLGTKEVHAAGAKRKTAGERRSKAPLDNTISCVADLQDKERFKIADFRVKRAIYCIKSTKNC